MPNSRKGKLPPTDYTPWECESYITNDVMGEKNQHFEVSRMSHPNTEDSVMGVKL